MSPELCQRILPVDVAVAQRYAKLQVPDPCSDRDPLIAATAFVHGMTVVPAMGHIASPSVSVS
jgi:toxin FitB